MKIKGLKQLLIGITIAFTALLLLNGAAVKSVSATSCGVYYTCPMPEDAGVVMDKPGKCPKCGMDLVAKKKEPVVKYTCPMPEDAGVVMDKPGKCPKCGMDLVPMKSEKK
jgi:transcription initiation factor IIE alpha subunit